MLFISKWVKKYEADYYKNVLNNMQVMFEYKQFLPCSSKGQSSLLL